MAIYSDVMAAMDSAITTMRDSGLAVVVGSGRFRYGTNGFKSETLRVMDG